VLWIWGGRGGFFGANPKNRTLVGWQDQTLPNHWAIAQLALNTFGEKW